MKKYYLLTAFGKDRPGIVAAVTRAVFEAGGNLEDASMTRLGGEFSMMLLTALPGPAALAALNKRLAPLRKPLALDVEVKAIQSSLARGADSRGTRFLISVYGTDKPGIVYRVAQLLAERKISITDLNTKATTRGRSAVYVMFMEIQVPDGFDLDDLRSGLDILRTELDVEITLQDIDAASL
ncbi:MAG TPA: ACT domain-containing protein [Elusimicrobiota bacterium]|nr:ACT domain-containing protein [Elusimicrobiota bacterium]